MTIGGVTLSYRCRNCDKSFCSDDEPASCPFCNSSDTGLPLLWHKDAMEKRLKTRETMKKIIDAIKDKAFETNDPIGGAFKVVLLEDVLKILEAL